jgi:fido (protein-threonine AMPylation protein)
MDEIAKFTIDHWIAIAAIVIPIFLGWLWKIYLWLWSLFKKYILDRKIEVVTPSLDERFATLNKQLRVCPFLDKKGSLSVDSLLRNHRALFQDSLASAGNLRTSDVYIKCYKVSDDNGGTTLVTDKESVTNLMPAMEVELTLSDIIDDWNAKVLRVKGYSEKEKIEFVSRFHLYFEMVHPFLDGNGRIGRELLEEQLSFLFDQTMKFEPEIKAYYQGITAGVRGDEAQLKKLISDQVKVNMGTYAVAT